MGTSIWSRSQTGPFKLFNTQRDYPCCTHGDAVAARRGGRIATLAHRPPRISPLTGPIITRSLAH